MARYAAMKPNNSKSIPASFRQTIWRSWLSWLLLLAYVWLNLSTYNPIIGGALALLAILLAMNGLAQTQQLFLVDDQHWWKRHPILYHLHKIFDEGEFAGILFALIFWFFMILRGGPIFSQGAEHFVTGPLTLLGIMSAANLAVRNMSALLNWLERRLGLYWAIVIGSCFSSFASLGAAVFIGDYFVARVSQKNRAAAATGFASSIGSGMGITPFAAPPVLIVWPSLVGTLGWNISTLALWVGVGSLLHVLVSTWRLRSLIDKDIPLPTIRHGFPTPLLGLLLIVGANILDAQHLVTWALNLSAGVIAWQAGRDYPSRWQALVLSLLLAGLELVGRETDPFIQAVANYIPVDLPPLLLAWILWYATAFTSHFADNALASRIFIGVAIALGSKLDAQLSDGSRMTDLLAASVVLGAIWGGFVLIPANLPNFRLARVFQVTPQEWAQSALKNYYLITIWIHPLWISALLWVPGLL